MQFIGKQKDSDYLNIRNFFLSNFDETYKKINFLCRKLCDDIILKHTLSVLTSKEDQSIGSPRLDQLFVDFYTVERDYNFYNSTKTHSKNHNVSLRGNGFLSFPWKRQSLSWMFDKFEDKNFICQYNDINHSITLVKPFNIYFVNRGNHSIACGKLFNKNGTIPCDSAIDYTNILNEYDFDGTYFKNKNGKKKNKPFYKELSYLFYLGKILVEINSPK